MPVVTCSVSGGVRLWLLRVSAAIRGLPLNIHFADSRALEFVARKVGSSSGDARKALAVCKAALESHASVGSASSSGGPLIGISAMNQTLCRSGSSSSANQHVELIREMELSCQLVLCALLRL